MDNISTITAEIEWPNAAGIDIPGLKGLIYKTYNDNIPVEIIYFHCEPAVAKGENYSSTILRVVVKTITASGMKKTIKLIVKIYNKSEAIQVLLKEFRQLERETEAFTSIFPLMEGLMDEFADKRSTLWPAMLGVLPNDQVVFSDLTEQNYVLINRVGWQGLDHACLVLRSLGRFHAMGKVLLDRDLIRKQDTKAYFLAYDSILQRKVLEGSIHMLSQALLNEKGSWSGEWKEIGKRLANQIPSIGHKMESLYRCSNAAFDVFNHGDLWSSNMMFQLMEYTNFPVSVKFLDYQFTHVGSFIWDINHYMYTSLRPSVRRAHKAQLLTEYSKSLSDNLKFFGYQGYIPSLVDVTSEYKRTLSAGLAMIASILPMASGSAAEPFRLDKLATEPPEIAFDHTIFSEEKYVREISDDLKFFVDNHVI